MPALTKELSAEYLALYNSLQFRKDKSDKLEWYVTRLIRHKYRYEDVSAKMRIPWYLIGAFHGRECSFDFSKALHNGDPWNKKTIHVPAGRGPFDSWEEAAIDALIYDGLDLVKDWTLDKILYNAEKLNGFGYRNKHPEVLSPYLWAGSFHYSSGGYEYDGRFRSSFIDDTIGVAVMIKELERLGIIKTNHQEPSKELDTEERQVLKQHPKQSSFSLWSRLKFWFRR